MRFLFRIAFALGAVALFLPFWHPQPSAGEAPVGPAEAFAAANAAFSDMRQFCTRQPDACSVGSQAAVAFGQKAQAAAKALYDFVDTQLAAQTSGAQAKVTAFGASQRTGRNTLTDADRVPPWRGAAFRPALAAAAKNS